jgi:hypothetical protein
MQMLQLQSTMSSSNVSSSGLLWKATVTAPQWQEPVYNLWPSMAAGRGPLCWGGSYLSPNAAPSYLHIGGQIQVR